MPCEVAKSIGLLFLNYFETMAKELPYFKFESAEWLTGRISFESFEMQGAFIHICSIYWQKLGAVKSRDLELRIGKKLFTDLLEKEYFFIDEDFISIKFLDEQFTEREAVSKKRSQAGAKGGKANAKQTEASAKQTEAEEKRIEEKRIEKNIEERKSDFYKVLSPYSISYSVKMVNDFFEYWSEHGYRDKKMRFEKEKSWSLEARLKRWSEKSWNKSEVNSADDGRHKTGLYNVI